MHKVSKFPSKTIKGQQKNQNPKKKHEPRQPLTWFTHKRKPRI